MEPWQEFFFSLPPPSLPFVFCRFRSRFLIFFLNLFLVGGVQIEMFDGSPPAAHCALYKQIGRSISLEVLIGVF